MRSPDSRIAFYTFAILCEPRGHEQVQGFFDRTGDVFAQAEQSEGFVDRDRRADPAKAWGPHVDLDAKGEPAKLDRGLLEKRQQANASHTS